MCAQGRGRGSGAIFSRKKGTEIFIRFLRAVLKSCLLNPSYRPRDDKEDRGAPGTFDRGDGAGGGAGAAQASAGPAGERR